MINITKHVTKYLYEAHFHAKDNLYGYNVYVIFDKLIHDFFDHSFYLFEIIQELKRYIQYTSIN